MCIQVSYVKCRAVAPICWPPCPGQRLVWRPIDCCHLPTWRCLPPPMTHRIQTSYKPPYAMRIPTSPRLSSKRKSHSVNNLTHLTKVVGSMAPAPPLPLLIYLLLRLMPFRLALTPFCPNHLTYPRPLRIQLLRSEQRKHSMVQSMIPLDIHKRNHCLPVPPYKYFPGKGPEKNAVETQGMLPLDDR